MDRTPDYTRCALRALTALEKGQDADSSALLVAGAQVYALLAISAAISDLTATFVQLNTEVG